MGFGGFWIFAKLAPIFVGRIELIDRDLGIGVKYAPLTNESADWRGEVAHLRDCFVGGRKPGEVVLIVDSKPLQAIERPIEDASEFLANVVLQFVILLAQPRARRCQQYEAAD